MMKFTVGGRTFSQKDFFKKIGQEVVDNGLKKFADRAHGIAASLVDPETGKHANVVVRRAGVKILIHTAGSPMFARELERRLGVEVGTVESVASQRNKKPPQVYLAHASEDHDAFARPLAEMLMANGIDVWLDAWEIRAGDSLKRKMEEGLETCTHFLVLLTPWSLGKAWVETEIDAGFVRAVEGHAKFIGVRNGVEVQQLSAFLRTLHCPELDLSKPEHLASLIADIHEANRKPTRGPAPKYVKAVPEGLSAWAPTAIAVAEHLVRTSEGGEKFDPQLTVAELAQATGLSEQDVRLGVLDLQDNGLIEDTQTIGEDCFYPLIGLFVEFDRHFLDFDNRVDGVSIANRLISEAVDSISIPELAKWFPEWTRRRMNSALNYLEEVRAIEADRYIDGGMYTMSALRVNNRTHRFVRSNR